MTNCSNCGNDVTGKKFCPECGTAVQVAAPTAVDTSNNTCPRCNGVVKPGASFCMHCGSSLSAHAVAATAQSQPSQPVTRQCIACHSEVSAESAFCTNCGQTMQQSAVPPTVVAPSQTLCANCGRQNAPGTRFCGGCGSSLAAGTATPPPPTVYPQTGPYGQPSQYEQPQYGTQYPQQGQQYQQYPQQGQQYPQQYGQAGYQQQPMVLRCPVCMAMSPLGTANCPGCRTSLAGVAPTPAAMQMQGQQGGFGGFLQGSGGQMAVGALGGAAAVIGGEMLLHGIEREHERDRYDRGDGGGLLGDVGGLANDLGLF